jgi:hypothetical protein
VLTEEREDVLLTDDRRSVLEHHGRDRVGARCFQQNCAVVALDGHLAVDVVEAELC